MEGIGPGDFGKAKIEVGSSDFAEVVLNRENGNSPSSSGSTNLTFNVPYKGK
jgi:hypothetical protein